MGDAAVGALFGWLFGLFGWIAPLIGDLLLALYGAVFGAVVGALLGALGHASTRGRRDFSSLPSFRAHSYDVLAATEVADRARELLRAEDGPGLGQAADAR